MVWFQCEDCGENLKKPKLHNHLRICFATKLSCIDCGETFGQESVQGHTQCMTEAEKYGPKGQGKASNGGTPKPNKDSKQKLDVDVNVGLSERPPWFCSLCNTKATSKQTLLLHADGKKHRAKARAFHAAKQQLKQTEESAPDSNAPIQNIPKAELLNDKHVEQQKVQDTPKINVAHIDSVKEKGKVTSKKKRKLDASGSDDTEKRTGDDATDEGNNSENQGERRKPKDVESISKKFKPGVLKDDEAVDSGSMREDTEKKMKWKKLIKSFLKSNDGLLKMRKLKKLVLKSLQESGMVEDETQLSNMLEQKINSSSSFRMDGRYVHLAAKE